MELVYELNRELDRLLDDKIQKGDFDYQEEIHKRIDEQQKEIYKRIDEQRESKRQMTRSEEETQTPPKDWEEPERLLQGPSQFSVDSWRNVYMLVHELIHQRQAELNPSEFTVLASAELDNIDPSTSRGELYNLLLEAHKADAETLRVNTLFYPVIEGMAVLGSFYVMGRLITDLTASGETEIADKVTRVRRRQIHLETVVNKREERTREDNTDRYYLNYLEGIGIMKKLYKQFGLENVPRILATVDLHACRQITKGSLEYQQIIENPALLPGLQQVA